MESKSKNNLSRVNKYYGPNKFEISSLENKLLAIDIKSLDEKNKIILTNNISNFYKEIEVPKRGDWLWEHREKGQTFNSYKSDMINSPTRQNDTIFIQNLDDGLDNEISFLSEDVLENLRKILELYYTGIKVKINPIKNNFKTLKIPSRYHLSYFQYHGGKTIEKLAHFKPKGGLLIIGLTCYDIYPSDEWNFVFGLANKQLGCGVFSFRRYYDHIKENNKDKSDFTNIITKLAGKVMIHETGHLFGLDHCIYFKCLMNGSNHMEENLKKPFEFCPVCLRKISFNLKFDIVERFKKLAEGLENIDSNLYKDEINWYNERLKLI